mmetsp:Transcript_111141/g.175180  ORF Transcript_111141/g.175180 Transcript_111141/m.175180 type:complete len:207 (+) Transcript_111141:1057-1677(+)
MQEARAFKLPHIWKYRGLHNLYTKGRQLRKVYKVQSVVVCVCVELPRRGVLTHGCIRQEQISRIFDRLLQFIGNRQCGFLTFGPCRNAIRNPCIPDCDCLHWSYVGVSWQTNCIKNESIWCRNLDQEGLTSQRRRKVNTETNHIYVGREVTYKPLHLRLNSSIHEGTFQRKACPISIVCVKRVLRANIPKNNLPQIAGSICCRIVH